MLTDQYIYEFCKTLNQPYFGAYMFATQGDVRRHAYMQGLVELEGLRKNGASVMVLEIGSWAGGSAITWAQALKKYHQGNGRVICVDSWTPFFDPKSITSDDSAIIYKEMHEALTSGKIYELFLHNIKASGHDDLVHPFRGPSAAILPILRDASFDIVFIDGSHAYQEVCRDIQNSLRLVPEGGVLCGDDLELQAFEIDRANAMQHLDKDFIVDPKTGQSYHPGVSLAVEKYLGQVSSWQDFWAVRKHGQQWTKVEFLASQEMSVPAHLVNSTASLVLQMIEHGKRIGILK